MAELLPLKIYFLVKSLTLNATNKQKLSFMIAKLVAIASQQNK